MEKVKHLPENQNQPYEKFVSHGPKSLTDSELIAIMLRTGTKDKSALMLAQEVLQAGNYEKKGILGLYDISLKDLCRIKGIGMVKAVKLKCILELSMRLSTAHAREGLIVRQPKTIACYYMEQLRHRKTECVIVACIDGKGELTYEKKISEGSVKMSLISPREIFLQALKHEAVNIILVHNHPSGDPTPSKADEILTQNVAMAGKQMDIPLLDHIIIGDNSYFSFREAELL
ncbi:MAG: DNA repair protein RadC [Lachnospiraceae bacterium]|nr:DNA repair protein RadC [Lachnospiraceae bacterium]